jgi:hypothetical protein
MAKNTPILNGAFEVIGIVPGLVGYKKGYVDLSKINAAEAEKLVKQGFPYLRKVEKQVKKLEEPKEDKGK